MTAKRFTIENDIEMKDNWNINKRCYHFGNGFDAKDCCNMLNELQEENEQLNQFKKKFYNVIDKRIRVLEHDYNQAVKNGMPSNSVYSEIELLEELKEEMDHI